MFASLVEVAGNIPLCPGSGSILGMPCALGDHKLDLLSDFCLSLSSRKSLSPGYLPAPYPGIKDFSSLIAAVGLECIDHVGSHMRKRQKESKGPEYIKLQTHGDTWDFTLRRIGNYQRVLISDMI